MKFFKTLIASTLGILLAFVLIFFIGLITISSTAEEPEPYIRSNSVLKISMSGALPTKTSSNPIDELMNPERNNKVSLETLKENLSKAEAHDNIAGVWLEIDFMGEGWANLQEAHKMIRSFRDSSDKFVYASTNDIGYNEKGYYLATAADSVFSPPESFFEFDGFFSQVTFYDGAFEKLGIETEITRHGKYKGAVEPYYRKEMSEENEYQMSQIIGQVSQTFLSATSSKSGKSIPQLNELLNGTPTLTAQFGYEQQFIDSLMYPDEVETHIKKQIGVKESSSLQTVSNSRYAKVSKSSAGISSSSTSNKIAVIHANGPIVPNTFSDSPFGNQDLITTDFFQEQLKDIRDDDDVKALVVRISSPGGSGSTSDLIWRMLKETQKEMPVIISMGNVAASGGYYIAIAGDKIVAEPTTITGSIGVFGTKFNMKQLFNDKLGLTFDEVKSHDHADWLTQTREFTSAEQKAFQQYIDTFYRTFVNKVAKGRDLSFEEADEVAQGRVWTGAAALEQGLVDELGGLDRALQLAAEESGIDNYSLDQYPKQKSFYDVLMGSAGAQAKAIIGEQWFTNPMTQKMQEHLSILKHRDALLFFPYDINIQ
ncbi:signal peptide peptidase SppA [Fodinibius halophilus]|uniref:Signal peptide peptidase SppA n=1 Tax=Fodinibius halophilus TaxID=1736908 RepID=A0A6M1TCA4_9BACT|nr:signal peptide peptidase SppA [Fodinibius halophilus]NGP87862.1 signal peptide peptidase SppA [Fodinibius halophilus]